MHQQTRRVGEHLARGLRGLHWPECGDDLAEFANFPSTSLGFDPHPFGVITRSCGLRV